MNGLLVTNLDSELDSKNCIKVLQNSFYENMISKFTDDKLFVETDKYICGLDGVILNKKELLENSKTITLLEYIEAELERKNYTFYSLFRGVFNGFIFFKESGNLICFVDHFANKPLFYFEKEGKYVVGNTLKDVCDVLVNNNIKGTINQNAIRDLLTYSFVIRNETLVSEICRIPAGCYLSFTVDGSFEIQRYFVLSQENTIEVSEDEAIEEIDRLFRKAVQLEYEKDIEYGYKHLATLSAGMDSRMNNYVADSLGYHDILNVSFAQYESLDMKNPAKMSEELEHKWIYRSLNDASCLLDWKRMVEYENGLSCYWNAAHEFQTFEVFDWEKYGLYHTGMIGDAILSTSFSRKRIYKGDFIGASSDFSVKKVSLRTDNEMIDNGMTEELYFLYGRGFQGANTGVMPEFRYTEVVSPFLYVDLVEYCMSLPQEMRYNHNIYFKWVLKKYPKAAQISWNGVRIKDVLKEPFKVKASKKIHRYKKRLYKKLNIRIKPRKEKPLVEGMNPLDYWYNSKHHIKQALDEFYETGIEKWGKYIEDIEAIKDAYSNGLTMNKTYCITVLAALEEYKDIFDL